MFSPSQDILQRVTDQAAVLDVSVTELGIIASRQPALLRVSPENLLEECQTVGRPLGMPTAGALQLMAKMTPAELRLLLRLSAVDIRARVDNLRQELKDVLGEDAVSVAARACTTLEALRSARVLFVTRQVGSSWVWFCSSVQGAFGVDWHPFCMFACMGLSVT